MSDAGTTARSTSITVALIGNPNTGKSTLFNALTGGRARIGNFPGVTVEKKIGKFHHAGHEVQVIDLPGTYSLAPRSADEMVSVDVLLGRVPGLPRPDAVICIVDSANLERNLYLFSQVRDLHLPVLLVLNMWDIAQGEGIEIDVDRLEKQLEVRAIPVSAHRRQGISAVRDAVVEVARAPRCIPDSLFPEQFTAEVAALGEWLRQHAEEEVPVHLHPRILLDVHGEAEHRAALRTSAGLEEFLAGSRSRLAAAGCRVPLIETRVRYDWIRRQLEGTVHRSRPPGEATTSDRIDRFLTHRVWGLLVFAAVMFAVFQAIYTGAQPVMAIVENGQSAIGEAVQSLLPPGTLRSLLTDGVVAGVGSVLVFIPQIALLFAFIALMEDCGYMARAAFLMDRLMTQVGLSGKSFLPLMSSFACAIPGIMATRVIENRRDRMVTILVAPLMSCSARLPVYLLLTAAFIPATRLVGGLVGLQGLVLFGLHAIGVLVAIPVAWILKKTFFRGETPPFVMELPPYKWPSLRIVFDRVLERVQAFIVRAGSLIFCVTVLIWAAGYFPGDHAPLQRVEAEIDQLSGSAAESADVRLQELWQTKEQLSSELLRESWLGRAGQKLEPAVRPLGWDWRIGVGALASFPAREVIVATLGTIFSLGGDIEAEDPSLQSALQAATWPDGRPLFTIPVALSVMVFFALCAQCGATLLVIRRETNSWIWPIVTFVYMTTLAYLAALVVYQGGTALLG